MDKTGKNVDKNGFVGVILILLSIVFLIAGIALYHRECSYFQGLFTVKLSAHYFTYEAANINSFIFNGIKEHFWKFFKGYIIPFFLFLLPSIFMMAVGLGKLMGKEIKIFSFLEDDRKEKNFLVIMFVTSFLLTLLIHFVVLLNYPLTSDEFSYLFQSEIMATGRIYAETPAFADNMTGDNVVANDGKWYSKYTVGWPILLTFGVLARVPYVMNALLASASLLLLYLIAKRIFGKTAGVIAAFIAFLSPYFILHAATFYPHTSSGFFTLLLIFSFLKLTDEKKWKYSFIAGLSIAMILLIRPADGGIVCIGLFPWVLYTIIKSENKRDTVLKLTPILGGFCIGIASLLWVNYIQNDNPFLFSFVKNKASEQWGFGNIRHTPIKGLWNITYSTLRMGFWVAPYIFIGSLLSFLCRKKESFFLAIIVIGFPAFYFCYYSLGIVEFGSRYFYPAFVVLILLAAGGISKAIELFTSKGRFSRGNLISAFIVLCTLFMTLGIFPDLFNSITSVYKVNKKALIWLENPMNSRQKTITIIRYGPDEKTGPFIRNHWDYWKQNNISVVFLQPEENRQLINSFPDRTPYLVSYVDEKNFFSIEPYPSEDKPDAFDYIYAAANYEGSVCDVEKAIQVFEKAVKLSPENPSIEFSFGILYFKHDKFEEAAEIFQKIIKEHPEQTEAYYFLGRCLGYLEKKQEAMNAMEMYIRKSPNSTRVQTAREWLQYYSEMK